MGHPQGLQHRPRATISAPSVKKGGDLPAGQNPAAASVTEPKMGQPSLSAHCASGAARKTGVRLPSRSPRCHPSGLPFSKCRGAAQRHEAPCPRRPSPERRAPILAAWHQRPLAAHSAPLGALSGFPRPPLCSPSWRPPTHRSRLSVRLPVPSTRGDSARRGRERDAGWHSVKELIEK